MLGFSDDDLWRFTTSQVALEHLDVLASRLESGTSNHDNQALKENLAFVSKFIEEATVFKSGMEHFDPPYAPVISYLQDLLLPPSLWLRFNDAVKERIDNEEVEKERAKELRKVLYSIGGTAAGLVSDVDSKDESISALSSVVADHIAWLNEWKSEGAPLDGEVSSKLESAFRILKDGNIVCSHASWFSTFKKVLKSHLDVAGANQERQKAQTDYNIKLRELGNNLMASLSYPQAIKVYTTAIDSCSIFSANNLAQLYTNRAIAFIGLNCYPEAIQDLKLAIARDRTFVPAYAQLGYCELYMGRTLHALRSYKNALDAMAGNIDPPFTQLDFQQKEEYKQTMAASAFPQFVHKLVQAIISTEKRARQQRVSVNDLKFYMTEIKKTLVELQTAASPEDRHLFEYIYDEAFEQVRSTAHRAHQHRPSILTPEVASDILAGSSMEASTVAIPLPGMPGLPRRRDATANSTTTPTDAGASQTTRAADTRGSTTEGTTTPSEPPQTGTPQPEASLRGLMNQLGDIFGEMMQAQTSNYFPNDPPANGDRPVVDIRVEAFPISGQPTAPTQNQTPAQSTQAPTTAPPNTTNTEAASTAVPDPPESAPSTASDREGIPMRDLRDSLNQMMAGDYQPMFNSFMRHFERNGGSGSEVGEQPNIFRDFFRRAGELQASARDAQGQSARGTQSSDESMPDAPDVD